MILLRQGYISSFVGGCIFYKFQPSWMNVLIWINSFEYLLDFSKVHDDEKPFILLDMLEPCVLEKLHEKVYPLTPFHLPYDDIISELETVYSNLRTKAAANYRYKHRDQLPLETIQHYVLALIKLHNKCDNRTKRNFNIKDRFIDGITDVETKDILESNNYENMTFAMIITIAKQIEIFKNILSRRSFID